MECLAEALKGTAPNKAPGSDGLTYEVYKGWLTASMRPSRGWVCSQSRWLRRYG